MTALAFGPLWRLDEAWLQNTADASDNTRVEDLSDYFLPTWFDDIRPVFSRQTYNHYAHMNVESARTNNTVERFH